MKNAIILTICLSQSQLFDRDCRMRCEYQRTDWATRNGKCYCTDSENMKAEIFTIKPKIEQNSVFKYYEDE